MPSQTSTAILNYWQQSFWQIHYNQFPIQSIPDPFYQRELVLKGSIDLKDQPIWIAPFVFQNKSKDYWIPLWLPAIVQDKTIEIRKELALPWIPLLQLSALHGPTPFKEDFACYEDYLRFDCFEDEQLIWQDWLALFSAGENLLEKLAPDWQTSLKQMGYQLLADVIVHIEQPLQTHSSHLDNFVNIDPDFKNENATCIEVLDPREKRKYIENCCKQHQDVYLLTPNMPENVEANSLNENLLKLQNQDERLEKRLTQLKSWQQDKKLLGKKPIFAWFGKAKMNDIIFAEMEAVLEEKILDKTHISTQLSHAIRKITVERTKIHQQIVDIVESPKDNIHLKTSGWILFKLTTNHTWQAVWDIPAQMHNLIVDEANQMLPNQLLPYLHAITNIIYLGSENALSAMPLMSFYEDEINLKKYALDEETIEEMQYRGMLLSNGDLFKVAKQSCSQTINLMGENASPCVIQAIAVQGESTQINNQWQNEQEAQFIAKWLANYEGKERAALVTPFFCQKLCLQNAIQSAGITLPIFTFYELMAETFEEIIFSPVYQFESPRPFVFDQDEKLLKLMMAKAKKLWLIGDIRIFDAKMHSPSGSVGKRLENA